MPEGEKVNIKFRLYDGSDIGPDNYYPTSTVSDMKERIVAAWPQDKTIVPKAASDVKLICGGKILENSKTASQCRPPFADTSVGPITIHVVVQPSLAKTRTEKKVEELPGKSSCSCSIL